MSTSFNQVRKEQEKAYQVIGLVFAMLFGTFVRLVHVLPIQYPLNDGGFFLALIQDLQTSKSFLPSVTSYNQFDIPFAYPPLAMLVSELFSKIFKVSVIDLIRLTPPFVSSLTIPAFFLLARKLLPSMIQIISATLAFALLPTAFDWLIVGAGLTRSFGYLFAILTLIQLHSLYSTDHKRHIPLAILFASLTILSHPGTAWFAFYSGGVWFIFSIKWREYLSKSPANRPALGGTNSPRVRGWGAAGNITKSNGVVLGTALLTSPWWGTLIQRHGIGVLLYPYQTETFSISTLVMPLSLLFTNEPLADILAALGFLGFLYSIREQNFLIPAWLAAVFIFEPRLSAIYASLPVALLVGTGLEKGILPLVDTNQSTFPLRGMFSRLVIGFLLLYALISAYLAPQYHSLSQAQAESMQWVSQHTPKDSSFLVITGNPSYGDDYVGEWFPALSQRHSLTTPQGHEWLPDKEFSRRVRLHAELQSLASEDVAVLENWAQSENLSLSHIYIAKKALQENGIPFSIFQESLIHLSTYEIIYENEDALVLQYKAAQK